MPPNEDWYIKVEEQIKTLQEEFKMLRDQLTDNTQSTKNVEANTAGVVAAFKAAEGAFKVLEIIGKLAKPLLWIGGVATVILNWGHSMKNWISSFLK